MRTSAAALALISILALGACQQSSTDNAAAPTAPAATQQASTAQLTPEELGELGAKIEKTPASAQQLLAERGLTEVTFEQEIRKVSSDPEASRRYRDAYSKSRT